MTTITIDRAVVEQALEALESCNAGDYSTGHVIHPSFDVDAVNRAIDAVDEALAEQPAEQSAEHGEPVAWMCSNNELMHMGYQRFAATPGGDWNIPVYTAPQPAKPAERVPLTDDEIDAVPWGPHEGNPITFAEALRDFARAIEAAHGIGVEK